MSSYKRRSGVLEMELDGEVFLLPPGSQDALHLNAVGSEIWDLVDPAGTLADVATEIAARYGIPVAQAAEDVSRLVLELVERGALEPADAGR